MKEVSSTKESINNVPEITGVYQFVSDAGEILYVGKAKNLRSRLRSYFASKLERKTAQMVQRAYSIRYTPVPSEFEALLLEARLVKKYKPRYNIELRDDKSPLYIGISKDFYPRVLLLRQRELPHVELKYVYGPFVSARAARQILRRIRKIFPFSTHPVGRRACVYQEIGLCDPCPSYIETLEGKAREDKRDEYLQNIKNINRVLTGKIKTVVRVLEKEMKSYAEGEEFEKAGERREQLKLLEYLSSESEPTSSFIENPNLLDDIRDQEIKDLVKLLKSHLKIKKIARIECYDVAHLSGSHPTASMVTFVNGFPDKGLYRHFRVSKKRKNNDVDSLKQVLKRRIKHFHTWGEPDLIIIDGGKGQVSAAREVIPDRIPVVGLAKRYETIVIKSEEGFEEIRIGRRPALYLVQRLRDEAHRFARRYHHKLVTEALLKAGKK